MVDAFVLLVYVGIFGFALILAALVMDWVDSHAETGPLTYTEATDRLIKAMKK